MFAPTRTETKNLAACLVHGWHPLSPSKKGRPSKGPSGTVTSRRRGRSARQPTQSAVLGFSARVRGCVRLFLSTAFHLWLAVGRVPGSCRFRGAISLSVFIRHR